MAAAAAATSAPCASRTFLHERLCHSTRAEEKEKKKEKARRKRHHVPKTVQTRKKKKHDCLPAYHKMKQKKREISGRSYKKRVVFQTSLELVVLYTIPPPPSGARKRVHSAVVGCRRLALTCKKYFHSFPRLSLDEIFRLDVPPHDPQSVEPLTDLHNLRRRRG